MDSHSPEGAVRLREEQLKALENTANQMQQLEKYVSDYKSLQKRLNTLADCTKHDVMVPFGKLAFMPGQLIHTNEILVLLGDNWFCERSAKQAAAITGRRIGALDKQMDELNKQRGLLEPRLDFTTDLQHMFEKKSDVHEIQEEYDADREAAWKLEHKENVHLYRSALRAERETLVDTNQSQEDLWKRLEQLEIQEKVNREMLRMGDDGGDETCQSQLGERRVRFQDPGDSDDGTESDDETTATITFTHSAGYSAQADREGIVSPSDIYRQFVQHHAAKSILKPSLEPTELPSMDTLPRQEDSLDSKVGHELAFTGTIHEISPCVLENVSTPAQPPHTAADEAMQYSGKKPSLFKARQMKKK